MLTTILYSILGSVLFLMLYLVITHCRAMRTLWFYEAQGATRMYGAGTFVIGAIRNILEHLKLEM
jgi:hypothetical protein